MLTKVLLAISDKNLQAQIAGHLKSRNVIEKTVKSDSKLWEFMQYEPTDILILERKLISEPINENIKNIKKFPESPHIVVLTRKEDPEERADLIAMGCEAVLYSDVPFSTISGALDAILEKRKDIEKKAIDMDSFFAEARLNDFISYSPAMKSFMEVVYSVVKSDASLLLLGETGVGKERLARAIHNESLRSEGPFVPVNCGALPENLLESELFGHEKGSFTGATRQRRGSFELAHNGTVFLDEIGDLPYHLQVKLLRVLQEHIVQRVGSESSFKVDVRIIAATNQELNESVKTGKFRRDLFYRLNVIALTIPPLRERKEDIPELVESYLYYFSPRIRKNVNSITTEALKVMMNYEWPGNVRELINVIERAILLCQGDKITLKELPDDMCGKTTLNLSNGNTTQDMEPYIRIPHDWKNTKFKKFKKEVVQNAEIIYFSNVLKDANGKIVDAARKAGIQPRALFGKMRDLGLKKEDFKSVK